MTRHERIVVLAWSMGDAVATPAGSRDPRALMPTHRVECPSCRGLLTVADRFGRARACSLCDFGRGATGRVWVDGYTGERTGAPGSVVPLRDAPEQRVRVGCSWCQEGPRARWDEARGTWLPVEGRFELLPRGTGVRAGVRCLPCDGSGWRWLPLELFTEAAERGSAPAAGERVAWRLGGSYRELAMALVSLRDVDRPAYRAFQREVAAAAWPWPGSAGAAPRGLAYVSELMPGRIVVSGEVLKAWRSRHERASQIRGPRRNQRIRELVARGEAPSAVARRAGISESQVRRIAYGQVAS